MRNKISGLLIVSILMFSCQKKIKKESNSESNTSVNIEFTDDNGNKISKTELEKSKEVFNYGQFYGTDTVPELAQTLHNQALKFVQIEDYENAIKKLKQANKEAPNWVNPLYDIACAYLLQNDYENALKYYELTDKLATKGFYDSKIALHALRREKTGDLKKGAYKSYLALEWIDNKIVKELTIRSLVDEFPTFAPVWKEYALLLENTERLDAIEKGLAQNPDIETTGILLINKALVIDKNGDFEKASKILMGVIFDSNSTIANIEMSKFYLNSISEE